MMSKTLGIDIGTAFITAHDSIGTIMRFRHEGRIVRCLQEKIFPGFAGAGYCVFTGKGGKEIAGQMQGIYIDETVALSRLLADFNDRWFGGESGQVIDIGASSLTLYTVREGRVTDIAENTLCAAGTGLFLEEQAERLHMDLENKGALNVADPPLVASRCTVFAKSDLIHHQQEGRSRDEMWAGLCRSLVVSAVNTLFRGEEPQGRIVICGGVSLNPEVLRWFKHLYQDVEWIVPHHSEALMAQGASLAQGTPIESLNRSMTASRKQFKRMPPLELHKSDYPHMVEPVTDDSGSEIRIHSNIEDTQEVIMGMDIGSTSTKLAVLDARTAEPVLDIYRATAGEPVEAAKKVFATFYKITELIPGNQAKDDKTHSKIKIKSFGTTGSGRKLVGEIFGADCIVNEISAHARGATHFFPEVETIFEIGGQDAKFIRLQNGFAADVNMNYVCAAGTGSFVEEQARKLGFKIRDVGTVTAGIAPPVTSDRCTVFMEQDLRTLLKEGFSKEEALAAVLYSVIRNYLNRVVVNRRVSEKKIFFQGATARNKGLVAALENLLNVEVAVSPFCHVMGSIGAALIARERMELQSVETERYSAFVGPEAVNLEVTVKTELCKLCRNFCRINHIRRVKREQASGCIRSNRCFSWGYQCGRDPEETVRRDIPQFRLFAEKQQAFRAGNRITGEVKGRVTLVHALGNYTYNSLWADFFNRLGFRTHTTGITNSAVKKHSSRIASADFCFPVKAALGHMVKALEQQQEGGENGANYIFLPYLIAARTTLSTAQSYFCPYVESSPSVVRSTLARGGISMDRQLSPVIDFRHSVKEIADELYNHLKTRFPVKKKDCMLAFKGAFEAWEKQEQQFQESGSRFLGEVSEAETPVFLLVGRPYNLHDRGLNLGIPETIASRGYPVIPIDMLPLDLPQLENSNYHNVFWYYGQRILAAMRLVKKHKNLFPIYLSNFNCGPDSFLLSFAEEELSGKPLLVLELDEHDSDGGYLTRIEAFLDVAEAYMRQGVENLENSMPHVYTARRQPDLNGTIWIPPMHPSGSRAFAAVFRGFGYESRALDLEDQEALVLGKKYLRGGECLPMTLTLGAFLKQVQSEPSSGKHILLMPTTEGPCRFGQYNLMERMVFHRLGLDNVDILTPSSINTYQGLPEQLRRLLMHGSVGGEVLFKMLTATRPYERTTGDALDIYEKGMAGLERCLEKRERPVALIKEYAKAFASLPVIKEKKPLVGIVGEVYVRCNAFANVNLIETIEANGGEAWLSPIHEWILYVAYVESFAAKKRDRGLMDRGSALVKNLYLFKIEESYYKAAGNVLGNRHEPPIKDVVRAGAEYLPEEFEGEAILTIGRSVLFARQGAAMVVNAAPFGCMPGTLSSAILPEIKEKFEIPFLSLFYDGDIDVNHKVASLLKTIALDREPSLV